MRAHKISAGIPLLGHLAWLHRFCPLSPWFHPRLPLTCRVYRPGCIGVVSIRSRRLSLFIRRLASFLLGGPCSSFTSHQGLCAIYIYAWHMYIVKCCKCCIRIENIQWGPKWPLDIAVKEGGAWCCVSNKKAKGQYKIQNRTDMLRLVYRIPKNKRVLLYKGRTWCKTWRRTCCSTEIICDTKLAYATVLKDVEKKREICMTCGTQILQHLWSLSLPVADFFTRAFCGQVQYIPECNWVLLYKRKAWYCTEKFATKTTAFAVVRI